MINKEAAYQKISELVKRFEEQIDSYKNANYNETLTHRDFIPYKLLYFCKKGDYDYN